MIEGDTISTNFVEGYQIPDNVAPTKWGLSACTGKQEMTMHKVECDPCQVEAHRICHRKMLSICTSLVY